MCDARNLVVPEWLASDGVHWIADCTADHDLVDEATHHAGPVSHDVALHTGGFHRPEIHWLESDRRTFRGDLALCPAVFVHGRRWDWDNPKGVRCVLPLGHRGEHVS